MTFRALAKRLGFAVDRNAFDWNADKSNEAIKPSYCDNETNNNGKINEKMQ